MTPNQHTKNQDNEGKSIIPESPLRDKLDQTLSRLVEIEECKDFLREKLEFISVPTPSNPPPPPNADKIEGIDRDLEVTLSPLEICLTDITTRLECHLEDLRSMTNKLIT